MSRHGSLADQLKGVLAYRSRPETEEPIQPVQTNWRTLAANDNDPEEISDLSQDRKRIITPSIAEIMRQVDDGPVVRNEGIATTLGGVINKRLTAGQTVAIGRLAFSDGTQTEPAYRNTLDGKLERYAARMPTGAMLNSRDTSDVALGSGTTDHGGSNSFFQSVFRTEPHQYVTSGKRRKGQNFTNDEAQAMLDAAIANTIEMPTVTKCPDGLPYGTARVADNFIGMKKTTKGNGGSIAWQDLSTLMSERESWAAVMAELDQEDKGVLDFTMRAKTLTEVGQSAGMSHEYARRKGGKRRLMAANDNLMAAIRKAAA